MGSVSVNPPKTPVTKGSNGIATATIPNVCKMPGPPAPFVPTPLPNIGKSGKNPQGYTQDVTVEGNAVAIKGATFDSMGDVASKGTGGGLISANCEGITKFVGPGSMDVKFEGGNVQFLSDPMLNNCGPGGSPPNAATMVGVLQDTGMLYVPGDEACPLCGKQHGDDVKLEAGASAESGVSKVEAAINGALSHANAPAQVAARKARGSKTKKARYRGMMGAAVGKCGEQTFAGTSTTQYTDVVDRLKKDCHTPKAEGFSLESPPDKDTFNPDRLPDFEAKIAAAHKSTFQGLWNEYTEKAGASRTEGYTGESFYYPGYCAGQQVLMSALDHECRPVGLAERYFKFADDAEFPADKMNLRVRDGLSDKVGRFAKAYNPADKSGELAWDKPVPPCGTCNVILQALLCPDNKAPVCAHKKDDHCAKCNT